MTVRMMIGTGNGPRGTPAITTRPGTVRATTVAVCLPVHTHAPWRPAASRDFKSAGDSMNQALDEDVKTLHSMGYAQELARRMSGFSNFAISFSIGCILAGGIFSLPQAYCTGFGVPACVG